MSSWWFDRKEKERDGIFLSARRGYEYYVLPVLIASSILGQVMQPATLFESRRLS